MPPEVLMGHQYTNKSDIFSLGSILYNLVADKYIFKANNAYRAIGKNLRCEVSNKISNLKCSENLKNLLSKLLARDPSDRPVASEALNHEWFSEEFK